MTTASGATAGSCNPAPRTTPSAYWLKQEQPRRATEAIKRRLPRYATDEFRDAVTSVCADTAGIGPASLVLYDVTTLYWESDEGDGFFRTRVQ